jgi:CRP-like cAMP-binding protein
MKPLISPAVTDEQKEAVYRFRYDVYVEEMNRYRSIADHERRQLHEDVDDCSRLYIVTEADKAVGALRFTWGGDAPVTERHIDQYDLQPFLNCMPADQLVVGERFMVAPEFRGTDLLFRMFQMYLRFANEHRIQLIFGDCEPHLLNLYLGLGFRTYTKRNVNSPETGYLIPLVMVPEDMSYMRRIKSPLLKVLQDFTDDVRIPLKAIELLKRDTAVTSERLAEPDEYWSRVYEALSKVEHDRTSPFDGMTEEQAASCVSKSSAIECADGDRIVKKGNVARNMFIVLSGTLEARDGDTVVETLTVGDVFGEIAFLLGTPRSADVYAVSDDVRVLSLSESEIRKIIDSEPEVAARLMLNVSKMLCRRIYNRNV